MRKFRTAAEQEVGQNNARIFEACQDPTEIKLENFPKYVRRQHLKRFLAMHDIPTGRLDMSAMLEPENLTRRIYAFDTFAGFPTVHEKDKTAVAEVTPGGLYADSYDELRALVDEYDKDRFLGHIDKVHLIKGDVMETIPEFLASHPHLVVSLLYLDMDLFEPTKAALRHFVPRMPKGSLLVFDVLDNPLWPGETLAAVEELGLRRVALRRLEWDPYISYAILD